ncbi:alpha-1,4-glucan--maltose-1-phosphate maltosyltransferase [Janibacter corallicola]|uniref:alpha-1,4-glucan--maltose-1-phosphate maltosyltransferase n=1 Tax=Janibacter corallicola TaxID=415212 RepID=UPI0008327DC4|nr:alpha-1,4-glucan--maltose-1-phosphate maltosyltransferase [Janibacter corallicola]
MHADASNSAPDARRAARVPVSAPPQHPLGRIPVLDVAPCIDHGARPAKSVVGEPFEVTATVFREGHDAVGATVVLTDPDGTEHRVPMTCHNPGLAEWGAQVVADREGWWRYRVEGWSDPWATWVRDATVKVRADVDTRLMLEEGVLLLRRALADPTRGIEGRLALRSALEVLEGREEHHPTAALHLVTTGAAAEELLAHPVRELVTGSADLALLVERERALYGSWYEIFPRSEGARRDETTGRWTTGTLRTAARRLPAIADMGFDVVYLTPVHPIGTSARKGPNNTLEAGPDDPGSPYAIGSPDGGHDAIHPDLGTFEDFDALVAEAERLGLEVALDLALQCSPDHPWVGEHPEWFTERADGSIAFAENPPKKYQDIYPLNFDRDPEGIYREVRRVVQVWIDHGVRIFRVDNPHTKPVEFWQWLIADVAEDHPDVIWLAEAFTTPPMMHTLAKVGFQQSYTYFAWRNTAPELVEYGKQVAGEAAAYMRPSFWPTTHDILTPYLQFGGPAAWKVRAALAATMVPTWGIYAGYELMEHVARPGSEEQIDNEKYELKDRRWEEVGDASLAGWLTMLNRVRREHRALQLLRNLTFHHVDDENLLAYSKAATRADGTEDLVIVVANVDPHSTRESTLRLDMGALGMDHDERFAVTDLVTGQQWEWGRANFVRLGADAEPVHIVTVQRGRRS